MSWIALIISTFLLFSSESHAAGKNPVPKRLFGVELGQVFTGSNDDPKGNLPIKKWTGNHKFLGAGFHYYFEPLKEYKAFKYVERNEEKAKYFKTSFSLYTYRIIPEHVSSISDHNKQTTFDFMVSSINWEDPIEDSSKGYYWAIDLCRLLSADLRVEPEILDMNSMKDYRCYFREDDRELSVWSFGTISLDYIREKRDRLQDKFKNQIDQLRANEIKPY